METYEINTWGDPQGYPLLCPSETQCAYNVYDYVRTGINFGMFILFIILTILGIWLICRKHKGEKGLWKRIVKWELIFILILFLLWIIANLVLYYIRSIPVPAMPA